MFSLKQDQTTTTYKHVNLWLRLNSIAHMGYSRLSKSAKKLNLSIHELSKASEASLLAIGWNAQQTRALLGVNTAVETETNKTLAWLNQAPNRYFVSVNCASFPKLLKQITRPPLFLFVQGNLDILNSPQLAFVGSRKASSYATQITHQFVQALAQQTSASTVSGLALGVDAACHQASLLHNVPTIAVLGCGVDVIYPKRHQQLYADISKQGALVSEFLLGTQAMANLFPRRNRIISGLSLGTVVIEAKIRSGSLLTAKYAAEQNREVFAVPNHVNNPNAEGGHFLIKQGAKLIDGIGDIIEELPQIKKDPLELLKIEHAQKNKLLKKSNQSLASDLLLDNVDYSATSIDEIAKRTGMSLSDLLSQLLEYELRGLVASNAEGYVKLRG